LTQPLEVVGENGSMRDEGTRKAWAKNTLHSRAFSPPLSHGVPHIFLTAPLAYGAVASRLGPCKQLLHYGKLATSSNYEWIEFGVYTSFAHLVHYVEEVIKNFGEKYKIDFV
jgi:hypothetical protein